MITSEEVREAINLAKDYKAITGQAIDDDIIDVLEYANDLTTTVKRYFELKAKGITTEAEALEHRELLNKINEILSIKEK